jgi:hypothetical protein
MNMVLVLGRWEANAKGTNFVRRNQPQTMQQQQAFPIFNANRVTRWYGSIAALNDNPVDDGWALLSPSARFEAPQLHNLERGVQMTRSEKPT